MDPIIQFLNRYVNVLLLLVTAVYVIVTWFILLQNRRQVSLMKDQLENSNYNSFEAIVLNIDAEFVKNSDIRPFFYAGQEINPEDPRYEKSISMAEILIDFFDHILTVVEYNASEPDHWSKQYWEKWIVEMFSKSPLMRKYLETVKQWYPARLYELAQAGAKLVEEMKTKRNAQQIHTGEVA